MLKRAHLSPRVRAYTKAGSLDVQVIVGVREDDDDDGDSLPPSEHGYGWKPIWLKVTPRSKGPIWMHLTGMTLEELERFEQAVNLAIQDAKVIVADLDQQAYEVLMQGSTEVPIRALASAPPWFEREQDLRYQGPAQAVRAPLDDAL